MIKVTIQADYWLNENFEFDVSTEQAREKVVKTLEGLIHGLPQMVEEHNKATHHSFVTMHDKFICHIQCNEKYQKTGIKEPVTEITKL